MDFKFLIIFCAALFISSVRPEKQEFPMDLDVDEGDEAEVYAGEVADASENNFIKNLENIIKRHGENCAKKLLETGGKHLEENVLPRVLDKLHAAVEKRLNKENEESENNEIDENNEENDIETHSLKKKGKSILDKIKNAGSKIKNKVKEGGRKITKVGKKAKDKVKKGAGKIGEHIKKYWQKHKKQIAESGRKFSKQVHNALKQYGPKALNLASEILLNDVIPVMKEVIASECGVVENEVTGEEEELDAKENNEDTGEANEE